MKITREKHLDHMVRVVPIIVIGYAIQCTFITSMGGMALAGDGLFFLGACLVFMIAGFVAHDLTHEVALEEATLTVRIKWMKHQKVVAFTEIREILTSDPGESFSTMTLRLESGKKLRLFFVDDAQKVKSWIEAHQNGASRVAA